MDRIGSIRWREESTTTHNYAEPKIQRISNTAPLATRGVFHEANLKNEVYKRFSLFTKVFSTHERSLSFWNTPQAICNIDLYSTTYHCYKAQRQCIGCYRVTAGMWLAPRDPGWIWSYPHPMIAQLCWSRKGNKCDIIWSMGSQSWQIENWHPGKNMKYKWK